MIDIFLSRPTWVADSHKEGLTNFLSLLATMELSPRTLGTTDYPSKCPLDEVISLMDKCSGAIILGYPQITAINGSIKATEITTPLILPTEWNHIEAGLAYARDLPLLVIHHIGICRGIFDRGAIKNFLHGIDFSNPAWSLAKEITGALTTWKVDVLKGREKSKDSRASEQPKPQRVALTEEHIKTLQFVGQYEKQDVTAERIASLINTSEQKAKYLLEGLVNSELVEESSAMESDTSYNLTHGGRSALVERGLL